jgi:hypothetical protein
MHARTYCSISALVFTLVAAAHLVRAVAGWPLSIGSWQAPVAASVLATVVAAVLAGWGLREAARSPA